MNTVKYGFLVEDEAQKVFLQNYLNLLSAFLKVNIIFQANEDFIQRFRASDRTQVDNRFIEAAIKGFSEYNLDVFFVGRDSDHFDDLLLRELYEKKLERIGPQWRERIIILMPVQCIEHWLWYLQWKQENPSLTKNISLETKTRPEAKLQIYHTKRPSVEKTRFTVENLTKVFPIEYLESRSTSFVQFHQQTAHCIKNFSAKH